MKKLILIVISLLVGGGIIMLMGKSKKLETATFAGGCFWCVESSFSKLDGITTIVVGYAGGTEKKPTYKNYAKGGHIEAVQITYDPAKISYDQLLDTLWHTIDPTDAKGQFVDRGPQYRAAIFYHNNTQKKQALTSKAQLEQSGIFSKPIVTEITKLSPFYKAEEYHQDYAKKNPVKYKFYYYRSGRVTFFKKTWGKK